MKSNLVNFETEKSFPYYRIEIQLESQNWQNYRPNVFAHLYNLYSSEICLEVLWTQDHLCLNTDSHVGGKTYWKKYKNILENTSHGQLLVGNSICSLYLFWDSSSSSIDWKFGTGLFFIITSVQVHILYIEREKNQFGRSLKSIFSVIKIHLKGRVN